MNESVRGDGGAAGKKSTAASGRVVLFSVAHLMNDSYPNLYPILIPSLMPVLHFSVAQAGAITAVTAVTTQLLQPFMGLWADRTGGGWFVAGGLALGALLSSAALGLAPSYILLVAMLLVAGLGNSAFHPHASGIVGELTGKRKGLGMSMFLIGGNLGRGLAPLMASFAFLVWGRHGVVLLSIPGLILALILYFYARNIPRTFSGMPGELGKILKTNRGRLASLLAIVGVRNMVSSAVLTFLPIWWKMKYGQVSDMAFLLSIMLLVGSLGNLTGGYLSDLIGTVPVIVGSSVLSALLLVAFFYSTGFWIWIVVGLLGAALYSTASVTMVLGQSIFPRHKGMASGIALGVGNTLGAAGVGLLGIYAQHAGGTGVLDALRLLIPISLLSIPFVWSFIKRPPRQAVNEV